jgi:hypothetical protein
MTPISPPPRIDLVGPDFKITRPWRDYFSYITALDARLPGHAIEDEGVAVTQRATINFVGLGVTVADVGGKTQVTIPGGSGGGSLDDIIALQVLL